MARHSKTMSALFLKASCGYLIFLQPFGCRSVKYYCKVCRVTCSAGIPSAITQLKFWRICFGVMLSNLHEATILFLVRKEPLKKNEKAST